MAILRDVREMNDNDYIVIDMETGTVLGTNVVLAPAPKTEEELELILGNDGEAWSYGEANGIQLLVQLEN